MSAPLPYSLITSSIPDRLTKRYSLDAAGKPQKESAGPMAVGYVQHVQASDLYELAQQLDALQVNQAVAWGMSSRSDVRVVTKDQRSLHPGAIARCGDDFSYARAAGVWMIDHDAVPLGWLVKRMWSSKT